MFQPSALIRTLALFLLSQSVPCALSALDPNTAEVAGKLVLSFFSDRDQNARLDSIAARLSDIDRKLDQIQVQLEEISRGIYQIQQSIDHLPQEQARLDVLGRIRAMRLHFADWARNSSRKETRSEIRNFLNEFDSDIQKLLSTRPYPCLETVGLALAVERDLFELAGSARTTRRDTFETYRVFFARAQDPQEAGSLKQSFDVHFAQANSDRQWISSNTPRRRCYLGKIFYSENNGRSTCEAKIDQVVLGSLRDGFCWGPVNKSDVHCTREQHEHPGGDHPDHGFQLVGLAANFAGHGGPPAPAAAAAERPVPAFDRTGFLSVELDGAQPVGGCQAPARGDASLIGQTIDGTPNTYCADKLNERRNDFISHANVADSLAISLQSASKLEAEARRLRGQFGGH